MSRDTHGLDREARDAAIDAVRDLEEQAWKVNGQHPPPGAYVDHGLAAYFGALEPVAMITEPNRTGELIVHSLNALDLPAGTPLYPGPIQETSEP